MTTMRVDRLAELAEWLEAGAPHKGTIYGFDMRFVYAELDRFIGPDGVDRCGAVCCMAGAAIEFFGTSKQVREMHRNGNPDLDGRRAAKLLGISFCKQADYLFFPDESESSKPPISHKKIDAPWAARCVRKLIATGVVDWEGTHHV